MKPNETKRSRFVTEQLSDEKNENEHTKQKKSVRLC